MVVSEYDSKIIMYQKANPEDWRGDSDLITKRFLDSLECRELVLDAVKQEHQNRRAGV